jgi:2-polyprenyl-3-methyl-5-hydroxy-6-metoxy-1,4-benzoquinol methylase
MDSTICAVTGGLCMNERFDRYLTTHFAELGDVEIRSSHRLESIRANYADLVPDDPLQSILEIGPGLGELLHYLTRERCLTGVEAIDLSPEVAALCTARFCPTTHTPNPIEYLTARPARYDSIFLLHVLEHVEKVAAIEFVRALRGALKPGGRVVIEVPNMGNALVGLTYRYADFTHEMGFTEKSLAQLLRLGGFEDIEIRRFRIPLSSPARIAQYLLRAALEGSMRLLSRLYTNDVELNSANIVGIARRQP